MLVFNFDEERKAAYISGNTMYAVIENNQNGEVVIDTFFDEESANELKAIRERMADQLKFIFPFTVTVEAFDCHDSRFEIVRL